jgi:hypothetical protein
MGPGMPLSFELIKLLMVQISQLESLRRLEESLRTAEVQARPQILAGIQDLMEDIALSSRAIRDFKAAHFLVSRI